MLRSEEIKPVAIATIKLRLVSQSKFSNFIGRFINDLPNQYILPRCHKASKYFKLVFWDDILGQKKFDSYGQYFLWSGSCLQWN